MPVAQPHASAAPSRRFRAKPSAIVGVLGDVMNHPANRTRRVRSVLHLAACEARARVTGGAVVTQLGDHSRLRARLHRGGSWRVVRANPPDWAERMLWRGWLSPGDLFRD